MTLLRMTTIDTRYFQEQIHITSFYEYISRVLIYKAIIEQINDCIYT